MKTKYEGSNSTCKVAEESLPEKYLQCFKHKIEGLQVRENTWQLTSEGWENVLFTDECSKYLFQYPINPKNYNYCVGLAGMWCPWSVYPSEAKVMMWTSWQDRLHMLPSGQTLTPEKYFNQMLEKEVKPLTSRRHMTGSLIERKYVFWLKERGDIRSGWSSGSHFKSKSDMVLVSKKFAKLKLRMAGQWNLLISIPLEYHWWDNVQRSSPQNNEITEKATK